MQTRAHAYTHTHTYEWRLTEPEDGLSGMRVSVFVDVTTLDMLLNVFLDVRTLNVQKGSFPERDLATLPH